MMGKRYSDVQFTGMDFVGFKNGKAVAIAVKCDGKVGLRLNADTLHEWAESGYDIQTLPHEQACALFQEAMSALSDRAPDAGEQP
jgi:hypothetical protein